MRASGRLDLVEVAGVIHIDRRKSILLDDGVRSVWLPKSQIEVNDDGTVTMPEWLPIEKELV